MVAILCALRVRLLGVIMPQQYKKEYYQKNKQRILEKTRKYYHAHREQYQERRRKNKERDKKIKRIWYLKNREKTLKLHRQKNLENKIEVLEYYSNGKLRCVKCGFTDIRALSIDHINGNGAQHRKIVGRNVYNKLIQNDFPKGYQTLCMNCQFIKRDENKEMIKR